MSLDLKHLRYFLAVAEELSFSTAARRLYVSQQALSRTIQRLERELGVRLLERTTRSVSLTPAGQVLLDAGRRSIAGVEAAFDAARSAGNREPIRPVEVDVSSSGLETGAYLLRRMRRDQPEIPVREVAEGVPRGLVALREGRLGILFGLATQCPPTLRAEPVRREPVLVGMARNHPLAARPDVPVAMLSDVELLLPSDDAAPEWIEFVQRFCQEAGVRPRRWPGVTHGPVGAAEVVRDHGCVVPSVAWTAPPPDLVFRPLVDPSPLFTWSMMTLPRGEARPEVEALADCIRQG